MESIPGYDAWKTRGPPDPPSCTHCGDELDENWDCVECRKHTMSPEDERDAKGDDDYERSQEEN